MTDRRIAIFGVGGFGREVRWLIDDINAVQPRWDFVGYFDDHSEPRKIGSRAYLGSLGELNAWDGSLGVVFAVGDPVLKRRLVSAVHNPRVWFPTLIHPSCQIGIPVSSIGDGSIVCAGVMITVDVQIGRHVILNLGCTVGHDTVIRDYASFMPTVNISGDVVIGEAVYVGTGASIVNRVEIGDGTVVGAGAVVVRSLPAHCTAVGAPAKPIKFHESDRPTT